MTGFEQQKTDSLHMQYRAIRHGVAVMDFSSSGKLKLSGKNAVQFLNGLVSNEIKSLQPGEGVLAAFPNLQGKLVALCRIYNAGDHLLLELDAINREKVFKNLSRFVPAGEFFVDDLSDRVGLISLQGPRVAGLIESLTGEPISSEPKHNFSEREIDKTRISIAEHSRCGEPGFDVFVPSERFQQIRDFIVESGADYGARLIGQDAFEIARIESGIPREGVDAGENYIILESELNDAVSYTKGCYLGQEVIARIHWRGQPAKRLRGLIVDSESEQLRGAEIYAADGKRAGEITSSVKSIAVDSVIALAYVHRHYLNPGTEFTIKEKELEIGRAKLVELPFNIPQT